MIDHGDGLKTVYSSIDVNSSMKVGASVSAGDQIGTVSATTDVMGKEYNEGSHLHFETMENDQFINPTAYLDIEEK
ncbi:MAG: M23 family metallopeptidase [Candidatus Borkfalkia sp.]